MEKVDVMDKKGKILLISLNVPPVSESHSLRVIQFITYLHKFDWDLDVLTMSPPPNLPSIDQDSIKKLPNAVRIFRTYPGIISKMYYSKSMFASKYGSNYKKNRLHKKMFIKFTKTLEFILSDVISAPLFFNWYPFAIIKGVKLNTKYNYDVLISSGGHPVSHLIAYTIKKMRKLPWIADYGDPWVFDPTYRDKHSKIKFLMDYWLEQRVLKSVNVITVTTENTKKNYLVNYPILEKEKVKVIPMGVDYAVFKNIHAEYSKKYRLVYTGSLFPTQNIKPFLDAIKLLSENKEMKENIEILFIGNIREEFKELVTNMGLKDKISFGGFVPYEKSLSLMKGADLLLSFGNKGGLQVPGKLFDYVGSKRPILWIKGDERDPALRYLEGLNRVIITDNESKDIHSKIVMLYNLYKKQEIEKTFNLEELPAFSWEDRIKILDVLCERLVDANK